MMGILMSSRRFGIWLGVEVRRCGVVVVVVDSVIVIV